MAKVSFITIRDEYIAMTSEALAEYGVSTYKVSSESVGEVIIQPDGTELCVIDFETKLVESNALDAISLRIDQTPILILLEGSGSLCDHVVMLLNRFSHGKLDVLLEPFSREQLKDKVSECLNINHTQAWSNGINLEERTLAGWRKTRVFLPLPTFLQVKTPRYP